MSYSYFEKGADMYRETDISESYTKIFWFPACSEASFYIY